MGYSENPESRVSNAYRLADSAFSGSVRLEPSGAYITVWNTSPSRIPREKTHLELCLFKSNGQVSDSLVRLDLSQLAPCYPVGRRVWLVPWLEKDFTFLLYAEL